MASILTALLTLLPARAADWPAWSLPAPLPRPGRADLVYPDWFRGRWQVSDAGLRYEVRFQAGNPGVVGDRAFNAASVGRALLGGELLAVENDPANPNRQIARLAGDLWLESTVVGRRSETGTGRFWADELSLQVVHGPGDPRVSRVETLSRYVLEPDGRISGEQWQATYPSPALGLAARPRHSDHHTLVLTPLVRPISPPLPPGDRAS
jgi:hypothetical protein